MSYGRRAGGADMHLRLRQQPGVFRLKHPVPQTLTHLAERLLMLGRIDQVADLVRIDQRVVQLLHRLGRLPVQLLHPGQAARGGHARSSCMISAWSQ